MSGRGSGPRQREAALASARERVEQCLALAQGRSEEALHDLIDSQMELSTALLSLERRDEAQAAIEDAVATGRVLEEAHPGKGVGRLAMLLRSLGMVLSSAARTSGALEAQEEAVELLRTLLPESPDTVLPILAETVLSLGVTQDRLGKREEALASLREAVGLYRELAEKSPAQGLERLAEALGRLGDQQERLGRQEEFLRTSQEQVDLYRQLAEHDPARFLEPLAIHLESLGGTVLRLGRREEAAGLLAEVADLWVEQEESWASLWARYRVLRRLAGLRRELGQPEEARVAEDEEGDVCRRLSERFALPFAGHLWRLLEGHEGELDGDRREALLVSVEEAVDIYRRRSRRRPAEYLPALARGLTVLGRLLGELDRPREALSPALEAVQLLREQLKPESLDDHEELALGLQSLAERLAALGRVEEALSAVRESMEHLSVVGEELPSVFLDAKLAESLGTLSTLQRALGLKEQALSLASEALERLWRGFELFPELTGRRAGILLRRVSELHEECGRVPPPELRKRQQQWRKVMEARRRGA